MAVSKMMILKAVGPSLPFLRRTNCSRYEKLASGFLMIMIMVLVWTQGTSGEIQSNLTTVETWSDTQIKVTWQPLEQAHYKPYHYELHIDDHLEYFGNDVMYVARRLIPNTMYYFKLRLCVQNTNECTPYSKTLSGTTDQSQKRSLTKSFLQWMIVCIGVTVLACTTAVVGVKISRKLWRSFLYKYDYTSQTVVGLPKYLETTCGLDDEKPPLSLCRVDTSEKPDPRRGETLIFYDNSQKEKHADHLEIHENKLPLILEENQSFNSEQGSISEHWHCDTDEGSNIYELHANGSFVEQGRRATETFMVDNVKNHEIQNESDLEKCHDESCDFLQITDVEKSDSLGNWEDRVLEMESTKMNNTRHTPEQNTRKSSEGQFKTYQPEDFAKHHHFKNTRHEHTSQRHPPMAREEIREISLRHPPQLASDSREEIQEIVVAVDNSNVFIGAQESACLLNPRERKRNIRVKIQQLVKVLERGRTLSRAFVQGSSPPSTEQVWEVYRRLGYCVDLEDRRGKDEQRVDEGLHLHIYKALCELSPRKLVIASGDGNKGKSEGATSLPGCAQAAVDKGWLVEIHSWQHSLSAEWLKLARKYPVLVTIHYLDRYIDHITFVDGKHGRRCQPFPTDFLKRMS